MTDEEGRLLHEARWHIRSIQMAKEELRKLGIHVQEQIYLEKKWQHLIKDILDDRSRNDPPTGKDSGL